MKLKYSISYFIVIIIIIVGYTYGYATINEYKLNQYANLEEEIYEEIQEERIILSNSDDVINEGYFLYEEDGYVVVYLYDRVTIYEQTGIAISELNEELQEEIKAGKYIENEKILYAFLENYSS